MDAKGVFLNINVVYKNMDVKQKKLEKSQLEIIFELTAEEFQKHIDHAVSHLKGHVKIDGFRKGHVPENLAKEKIGKENLLMEAGDLAVKEVYKNYILENKLEPIGEPNVEIVKMAEGSPFVFKAKITILPEVELPDYKEIASKIKGLEISVDEKEVEDALKYLQRTKAKFSAQNKPAEKEDFVEIEYQSEDIENNKQMKDKFMLSQGGFVKGFEDNIIGMEAGHEKEFSARFPDNYQRKDLAGKEINFKVKMVTVQKVELPEINDEFAKEIGAFESLMALKTSIKEGAEMEKKEAEKQRKRGEILDKISEKSKVEIPGLLIAYEKERLLEDLKQKVSQNLKITFENYLASVKQTDESLIETFAKEAEKRIKNFLVLRQIGKDKNIKVMPEELSAEMEKVKKSYDKEQLDSIDINQLKEYAKGVIYNEKIFQLLENQSN